MARKPETDGVIRPDVGYTLEAAARTMGVGEGWLRNNLLNTGAVPHVRMNQSKYVWVLGKDILAWIDKQKE